MSKSRANTRTIKLTDGREVSFSYREPVAAFLPGRGYVKRGRHFSATSSRHATEYAGRFAAVLPDAEFLQAIAPVTAD